MQAQSRLLGTGLIFLTLVLTLAGILIAGHATPVANAQASTGTPVTATAAPTAMITATVASTATVPSITAPTPAVTATRTVSVTLPTIPPPLAVQVDPKTTALLVLDVTNVICSPRPSCVATVPADAALLKKARDAGALVVYSDTSATSTILPDVAPGPNDARVTGRADKFFGTSLDDTLKGKGIKTVVIVGYVANGAVLYTTFGANVRGYTAVVAMDGTGAEDPFAALLTYYQLLNEPGLANPANQALIESRVALSRSDLITFAAGAPPPQPPPTAAPANTATPAPTPTTLAVIPENTTKLNLTRVDIPPIKGKTASIDILEIDQAAHLLYVADRTDNGIDIFDVSTPNAKYVKTIDVGTGPNGVTVAKNVNKLFAGLNDSNVAIIDIDPASPKVNTVIARLNTGGKARADEMDYDPVDKKLYVANSDDGIVSVVDAVNNTIVKKYDQMGDGLEQPRYNSGDGMFYLTSSGQNAVFQFDPTKDVLVKKFDVGVPCDPNGLGINPTTNQALLGCSNKKTQQFLLWDLKAGQVLSTFNQAGAGDAVFYSAKADRYFFAASNFYRGGQMAILGGNPIKFLTNVPTAVGSHGVAFDETNNVVYTQDQLPNEGALFSFPLPATP